MKKIIATLFIALILTVNITAIFAQTGGQIPLGGRPGSQPDKSTSVIITATLEPKTKFSSEISDYLWTLANVLRQFKF